MTNAALDKQLERTLRMACASIAHASDGIAWITSDARIVEANAAYCRFFGYTREEMLMMRIPDFDPNYDEALWPVHWRALREHKRLIFETQSTCKNGEKVDVEVVANLVEFDGEEFNCAFLRDISARKRSEHHQHLLQTCVSRLNDIVLITEAEPVIGDGPRIVYVNPAFERRTGYSSAEVLGLTPRILQGPKTSRVELDRIRSCLQKWQPIRSQLLNYTKSGEEFWLEMDIVPIADESGWYTHWVAVERDISERVLQDQRKMEFISTVSHELRTPLTSVIGSLGLLMGNVFGTLPEKAQTMVKLAYENGQRMGNLINDLLDVQKMEVGMMQFEFAVLPLPNLLRDALASNTPFAQRLDVSLLLVGEVPECQIRVDAGRFAQAMANLLSNACKYSYRGGQVYLRARQHANRVRIEVQDHGCGIPETFRARIFQKFAQADASDSRMRGGTGLGLAITREIVQQMGGEIGFQSEVGKGALFFVELPLHIGD